MVDQNTRTEREERLFQRTIRRIQGNIGAAATFDRYSTTTSVVTAGLSEIFLDGFETGDTGGWSQSNPKEKGRRSE